MNYRMVFKSIGSVLFIEAACMAPSLLVSVFYREGIILAFLLSMLILVALGAGMKSIKTTSTNIYARDGFAIVALGWVMISFFGALPFVFSGAIPSFIDAIFESISGFSTTGATILTNIESLPKGILFWRSFTQWMGGMGVLVMTLAVMPSVKASTQYIMKAESPGPNPGKIVPQIGQTVKILYAIYVVLTLAEVICLLAGGMPLYDSLIHAFATAGTGGFSNKNLSVGAYGSAYIEVVITLFMLIFGINFTMHYYAIKGEWKTIARDEELRFYIATVIAAIGLIAINTYSAVFDNVWESIRHSAFQVSSIITTTGFTTADFNMWPVMSKCLLIFLMFLGASAGSTSGGIKCIRVLLLIKIARREIAKIIHPRSVYSIRIGGRKVDEETLSGVMAFFFLYMFIFVVSVLLISFEGKGLISTFSSVISTINNIGPGFENISPIGNYASFSVLSRIVFCFNMIVGRLELYPVLLLLTPSFWRRVNI